MIIALARFVSAHPTLTRLSVDKNSGFTGFTTFFFWDLLIKSPMLVMCKFKVALVITSYVFKAPVDC